MRSEPPLPFKGAASLTGPDVVRQALLSVAFKPGEGWRPNGGRFGWILDTREVTMDSRYLPLIGRMLWSLARRHSPDLVAGTGVSGGPLVASVLMAAGAEGARVAGAVVREQRKPYGRRRLVEGPQLPPGSRVVLLDDLASSGQTLLRVRESLLDAGLEVQAAVLLVDFERGARSALARVGMILDACYSLAELGIGRSSSGTHSWFSPAWHYAAGNREFTGTPHSSPVIKGDRVVFGTDTGDLVALDRDGALLWRRRLADPSAVQSLHSTARICGDAIFVGADDGYLYCTHLGSGEPAWRLRCGSAVGSSPAVDASVVVAERRTPAGGDVLSAACEYVVCVLDGRVGQALKRVFGCTSQYPAFHAEDHLVIGWHSGVNGPGNYCDHCEQADDHVKFILASRNRSSFAPCAPAAVNGGPKMAVILAGVNLGYDRLPLSCQQLR